MSTGPSLDELVLQVDCLARAVRGEWAAYIDTPGGRITGCGATPRAAIQDALAQKLQPPSEEIELW